MPRSRRRGYRAGDRIVRRRHQQELVTTLLLAAGGIVAFLLALLLLASLGGLFADLSGILPSAAIAPIVG